jgi:SAM-dependent methyltransferase
VLNRLTKRLRLGSYPALLGRRRTTVPLSQGWGNDRGTPIDRYFIDRFLREHAADIRGDVLEMADSRYTEAYGRTVTASDVLDIDPRKSGVTHVADLTRRETLPDAAYDCFILTQTLQYVYELAAAVDSVHRLLRIGGVALVTLPSVSRITASAGVEREFWRFTAASARTLFDAAFDEVEVRTYGNVLTCASFLYGLAAEELKPEELDEHDPHFPMLVGLRAVRR